MLVSWPRADGWGDQLGVVEDPSTLSWPPTKSSQRQGLEGRGDRGHGVSFLFLVLVDLHGGRGAGPYTSLQWTFIKIVNAFEQCTLKATNGLRIGSKARGECGLVSRLKRFFDKF